MLSEQDVADLCASFQEAVADVVADRTARAFDLYLERTGETAQRASSSQAGSRPTGD